MFHNNSLNHSTREKYYDFGVWCYVPCTAQPDISVMVDRRNVTDGQNAALSCAIRLFNGPERLSLEWRKNSIPISDSNDFDSPLVLHTADIDNPYGEYQCSASNGLFSSNETVLIAEKGRNS